MPGTPAEVTALRVAKAWHLSPQQFRTQPPDDQALMIAFEMFEATCESYRDEWREEQREKKKGGRDELEAMRRRMGLTT